ncbi:MAG: PAS domain-containing protein, partial [Selenomonadaceae bacterium]|nr:PAS domain-containing protein [Selenomonadaceae bacterium]
MLDFKPSFYEKIFAAPENNAVLIRVEADGKFFPVWCSQKFAEMIEGTAEEFIAAEYADSLKNIFPDDRAEVEYLFRNKVTREGKNSLTIRRRTLKNNSIWINARCDFVTEDGICYAYCNCFDVTKIKLDEQRAKNLYDGMRTELENLSGQTFLSLRMNLTRNLIEDCRGSELINNDLRGMKISERFNERLKYFPLERDRKKFLEKFNT